jgi:hypothetical protein
MKKLTLIAMLMASTAFAAEQLNEVRIVANRNAPFSAAGEYGQPEWTLTRKFPSTRVYVMTPPKAVIYEKWFEIRDRQNGPVQVRMTCMLTQSTMVQRTRSSLPGVDSVGRFVTL